VAGLMRAGIWRWMFSRWGDKLFARALEKHGAPYVYIQCKPDTPQSVRDEMLEFLQDLHSEKGAVLEEGGMIKFEPAAQISGTSLYETYMKYAQASIAKLWLGSSDLADPGSNGSNAAVNTRAGVTADPRMVAYGLGLGETVSDQLFRQALELNRHLFGGRIPPIPTYEADTATDEVQTDKQDLIEQSGGTIARGALEDTLDTGTPDPLKSDAGTSVTDVAASAEKAADTALNGAQVASMKDLVIAAATGQLPRDSAKAIIKRAFQMDDAAADEVLGSVGQGFVPDSQASAPEEVPMTDSAPKALTQSLSEPKRKRVKQERKRQSSSVQTTLPISSHSARLLAETLRGVSDDPEHS
jgi:phage gp29-like protein